MSELHKIKADTYSDEPDFYLENLEGICPDLLEPDMTNFLLDQIISHNSTGYSLKFEACVNNYAFSALFIQTIKKISELSEEDSSSMSDRQIIKKDFTRNIDRYYNEIQIVEFVNHIISLNDENKIDDCLDFIYSSLDEKLLSGNFVFCNNILKSIVIPKFETSVLLGLLTITLPWKTKISARHIFYRNVRGVLLQRFTELKTRRLLIGLK